MSFPLTGDLSRRADLALLVVALIWGTTFTLVGAAMGGTSPIVFLVLRFGLAVVCMVPFLRGARWNRAVLIHGIGIGFIGFLGFWFQTAGLRWTTPSRSAFITGLSVILVPFLSLTLLRKKPAPAAIVGACLACLGLVVLTRPDAGGWNQGDLLTLGCAVAWAGYILWVHYATRVVGQEGLRTLVFMQMASTGAFALIALPLENIRIDVGPTLILALLVTAPLATTLNYFLQNWAQARTTPTRTAVILTMEPVFAAFIAWMAGVERLPPTAWLGGVLIIGGMLIAEIRPRKKAEGNVLPTPDDSNSEIR